MARVEASALSISGRAAAVAIEIPTLSAPRPGRDVPVRPLRLPQFGNDIRIEQIHQEKSTDRQSSESRRGGSKSTLSSGMASRSAMLSRVAVIRWYSSMLSRT
jgi:hypothetical protein